MQYKKHKIVTLGEVLMRLTPPNFQKYNQANQVDIDFGGTEANVSVALSHLSCVCVHVTSLPNDFIGESVTGFLKKNSINTQYISRNNHPLGLYFMEQGAVHRSSRISYNRLHSAFAHIQPEDFDWNSILEGADWFHWTGITPAISKNAYLTLKEALKVAKEKNITVSTDPVYRSNLWKYDANPKEILKELAALSEVFIGGPEEVNLLYGTDYSYKQFKESADFLLEKLPNVKHIIHKTRIAKNASSHSISSEYYNGKEHFKTESIEITHVIDRIGTGDAFAAGLIYGMLKKDNEKALAYANSLSALKHTIPGDVSLISEEELNQAVDSNLNARIIR